MELVRVNLKDLNSIGYNPEVRTKKSNLKEMEASLKEFGQIAPLVISRDNVIIDGHRRVAAALNSGITSLWAVITDIDKATGFSEANRTSRKMNGRELFEAWRSGGKLPKSVQKAYDELSTYLSQEDFDLIADHRKDPMSTARNEVRPLLEYLELEPTKENKRKVLLWMCVNNATHAARRARFSFVNKNIILEYINSNVELPY